MTPNSQLKARAKAQLGGIFQSNWLMALVVCLIYFALLGLGSSFGIGAILVEGLLFIPLSAIFLSLVRCKKSTVEIADLFKLPENMGDTILLALLRNIFLALWFMLFFFPGVIKFYSYSMAYYIKIDHPDYDWKRCIDESRVLMNGKKWKLFCLDLSFIGWILLSIFTFGIILLWVAPYMEAARANFYADLVDGPATTVEGNVA